MTTSTLTVTDFVLARLAEDEAVAQERALLTPMDVAFEWGADRDYLEPYLSVNPARVLAQCAAMRKIVEHPSAPDAIVEWEDTVATLASIWSDHPQFNRDWS